MKMNDSMRRVELIGSATNRVYDSNRLVEALEGYSFREVVEMFWNEDDSPSVGDWQLIYLEDYLPAFVSSTGEAYTLLLEEDMLDDPDYDYLLEDKTLLPWFLSPIVGDGGEFVQSSEVLWETKWSPTSSEHFETIRFPRVTDFYEKNRFWPYVDNEPLTLLAEFWLDGRKVHVFWNQLNRGSGISKEAIFFEGGPIPANVVKGELPDEGIRTYVVQKTNHVDFPNFKLTEGHHYVPERPLMKTLEICQGEQLPYNGMIPVAHFPVDLRTEEELNTGDMGSMIIFWDKKDAFETCYVQT